MIELGSVYTHTQLLYSLLMILFLCVITMYGRVDRGRVQPHPPDPPSSLPKASHTHTHTTPQRDGPPAYSAYYTNFTRHVIICGTNDFSDNKSLVTFTFLSLLPPSPPPPPPVLPWPPRLFSCQCRFPDSLGKVRIVSCFRLSAAMSGGCCY